MTFRIRGFSGAVFRRQQINGQPLLKLRASLVAQMAKNLPAMQETWVQSLGQEDPLEKRMVTHSSILGLPRWFRIHLQCRRPGFNPWAGKISWRREWLPTPVLLPGESHGQRGLVGYSPQDHKELDNTLL